MSAKKISDIFFKMWIKNSVNNKYANVYQTCCNNLSKSCSFIPIRKDK